MAVDERDIAFPEDGGCFGCSPTNPVGLHLRFRRTGDGVAATHTVPEHFHGAPGVAHGGIVATILDEVSCAAIFFCRGCWVVTGELSVRYLLPCPVGRPLELLARLADERHAKYVVVEAEVRAGDVVVARSTGKFFPQARTEAAP
jgi:acyl-coenzyme A thioesterase PaaI-like protein